jgi:hypothetical protein
MTVTSVLSRWNAGQTHEALLILARYYWFNDSQIFSKERGESGKVSASS